MPPKKKRVELFLPLDVDFDADEKVRRLVRYGKDARACRDLLVAMWRYCKKHATDGHVPVEELGILAYPDSQKIGERDADRIVAVGLAERTEDGYYLPGFLKRNKSRAQLDAERAESAEESSESGRWGNHVKWHVNRGVAKSGCEFCESGTDRGTPINNVASGRDEGIGFDRTEDRGQRTEDRGQVLGSVGKTGGGSVTRLPPPPRNPKVKGTCPAHPDGTSAACADCRADRLRAETAEAERAALATAATAAETARRLACPRCDDNGLRELSDLAVVRCDHRPESRAS